MRTRWFLIVLAIAGCFSWSLPAEAAETEAATAYCWVDCWYGPDVSCEATDCYAHDEPGGFIWCDGVFSYCDPPPLLVSCSIVSCEMAGKSAVYTVRATASGGCGSYSFQWFSAMPISPPTDNPNEAEEAVAYKQDRVTAQVTACGATASCSVTLYPGCEVP